MRHRRRGTNGQSPWGWWFEEIPRARVASEERERTGCGSGCGTSEGPCRERVLPRRLGRRHGRPKRPKPRAETPSRDRESTTMADEGDVCRRGRGRGRHRERRASRTLCQVRSGSSSEEDAKDGRHPAHRSVPGRTRCETDVNRRGSTRPCERSSAPTVLSRGSRFPIPRRGPPFLLPRRPTFLPRSSAARVRRRPCGFAVSWPVQCSQRRRHRSSWFRRALVRSLFIRSGPSECLQDLVVDAGRRHVSAAATKGRSDAPAALGFAVGSQQRIHVLLESAVERDHVRSSWRGRDASTSFTHGRISFVRRKGE